MPEPRSLLILGARKGSIGDHTHEAALQSGRWSTVTVAGIHEADLNVDLRSQSERMRLLNHRGFHDVVCTVGINQETPVAEHLGLFEEWLQMHMNVNAVAPLAFLNEWASWWKASGAGWPIGGINFMCVSSNSAHIARSQSTAYCASKAALSMGLRTMARAMADWPIPINVVGYEFGWVKGTPMSQSVELRLDHDVALHRIPGGRALTAQQAGRLLVGELIDGRAYYKNGCTIRIDGGEQ